MDIMLKKGSGAISEHPVAHIHILKIHPVGSEAK